GRGLGELPPLAGLYLGASLDAAGLGWALHDAQLNRQINAFDVDALTAQIRTLRAPVIAFSVFNDAIPLLIATLDQMADELADRRVIVGGPGVVGIAGALMERVPRLEAVVVGEGETALPSLVTRQLEP